MQLNPRAVDERYCMQQTAVPGMLLRELPIMPAAPCFCCFLCISSSVYGVRDRIFHAEFAGNQRTLLSDTEIKNAECEELDGGFR
jgi:hypothetical protein